MLAGTPASFADAAIALLLEAVLNGRAAVHAHDDRGDSEGDQDHGRHHTSDFKDLTHFKLPSLAADLLKFVRPFPPNCAAVTPVGHQRDL